MAVGNAYATPEEYRNFKGAHSGRDDNALESQLKAVSRLLDSKLNQPYGFNRDDDDAPSTFIYGPRDIPRPIVNSTGLVVKTAYAGGAIDWDDADALELDTDYELRPQTPAPGWPYTSIYLFSLSSRSSILDIGTYRGRNTRARVTAVHGWPAVPDAIRWATIELTAILRAESPFATGRITELGAEAITASPQARALLGQLSQTYNPYPVVIA